MGRTARVPQPCQLLPLACQGLLQVAARDMSDGPAAVSNVVVGTGEEVGRTLAASSAVPLVSATGSVRMGKAVAPVVAKY